MNEYEKLDNTSTSGSVVAAVIPTPIVQNLNGALTQPHQMAENSLSCVLYTMLTNGTLCDVRFVSSNGDIVCAHRVILAAWSEPFRVMFSKGWQEASDYQCEIPVDDADMKPLRMIIEFMYTGAIQIKIETAISVLALANRFAVVALQSMTEAFIESELTVDNCCLYLSAADRFGCDQLRRTCFDFIVKHFEPVTATKGFAELPSAIVRDLISNDLLFVRSEECVYRAVSLWIAADAGRLSQAADVLNLVRFPLISTRFLHEVVETDDLIANLPSVSSMLLEAYRFHAMTSEGIPVPLSPNCIERGHEQIIFGDKAGRLCPLSSSMSGNHPLSNVRTHDDK